MINLLHPNRLIWDNASGGAGAPGTGEAMPGAESPGEAPGEGIKQTGNARENSDQAIKIGDKKVKDSNKQVVSMAREIQGERPSSSED